MIIDLLKNLKIIQPSPSVIINTVLSWWSHDTYCLFWCGWPGNSWEVDFKSYLGSNFLLAQLLFQSTAWSQIGASEHVHAPAKRMKTCKRMVFLFFFLIVTQVKDKMIMWLIKRKVVPMITVSLSDCYGNPLKWRHLSVSGQHTP